MPPETPESGVPLKDFRRKKRRRLTPMQQKGIKFLTENPEATYAEIAQAMGSKSKSPAQAGYSFITSRTAQERMAEAMEKDPALSDEAIRFKLKEGLNAKKKSYFAHQGEVQDERVDIDFSTRFSYLDLTTRIKGLSVLQKHEISGKNGGPIEHNLTSLAGLDEVKLLALIADLVKDQGIGDGVQK